MVSPVSATTLEHLNWNWMGWEEDRELLTTLASTHADWATRGRLIVWCKWWTPTPKHPKCSCPKHLSFLVPMPKTPSQVVPIPNLDPRQCHSWTFPVQGEGHRQRSDVCLCGCVEQPDLQGAKNQSGTTNTAVTVNEVKTFLESKLISHGHCNDHDLQ